MNSGANPDRRQFNVKFRSGEEADIMKKQFLSTFFVVLLLTVSFELGHSEAAMLTENGPQVAPFGSLEYAQIFFQPAQSRGNGKEPCVAINSVGDIMQVHRSQDRLDLWTRCGTLNSNNTITWGVSSGYGGGVTPSIAMSDPTDGIGYYFEMHQSENTDHLWYSWGEYQSKQRTFVEWGNHSIESGMNPSVAIMNNGSLVNVHESQDHDDLWYRCGHIDFQTKRVEWADSHGYGGGVTPSIAMIRDVDSPYKGFLVEVHQSQDHDTLWYRVGRNQGPIIKWSEQPFESYTKGANPSVTVTNDGYVIESHESQDSDTLWYMVGKIDFDKWTIDWGPSREYDNGVSPSVAMNENFVVQIHKSEDHDALWYTSALIFDHSRWMEGLRNVIGDKPLWQITLPGTHDAGMYTTHDILIQEFHWLEKYAKTWVRDHWVKTQGQTIYEQLMGGVRYLDLRPAVHHSEYYYIYHSFAGPEVYQVLSDIRAFMDYSQKTGAGELVIVALSHMRSFGVSNYKELGALITEYLEPYLYTVQDPQKANFLETTFNQYTKTGSPRVLFLVKSTEYEDWVNSGVKPPPGVWPYQEMDSGDLPVPVSGNMRIINDYANKYERLKMEKDQFFKLVSTQGGNDKRMFLLSWTLTAPEDGKWWAARFLGYSPHSIHDMSQSAKPDLAPFLRTYSDRYKINILFTDYYQEAATPDLAYLMNKGVLTEPPGPPALDIKANGHDDPVLIKSGTPVTITVTLNPGYRENLNADLWIAASTPKGWYSYVNFLGWQEGLKPYDQDILTEISPPLELPGLSLSNGVYTYYFAVDDNADGLPDAAWVDQVDVNVTSWR